MSTKIKGLTIEIGGSTVQLQKSMSEVNKKSKDLQSELASVNRLLKLDPKNTDLIAQKQKILADAVSATSDKLGQLKEAERQVIEQFQRGEVAEEAVRELQRTIVRTEQDLNRLTEASEQMNHTMSQNFKDAGKKLQDFGGKAIGVGKNMTAAVTLPIVAAGAASFKMAADLQDAFGATDQIFKTSADEVKNWADNLDSYYGIAEGEALTYANTMGSMLQNIGGLSEAEAAKQAETLVQLSGDLAAMFGGSTESAVQALTGALKGNASMLDNYGMGVNEATIKSKALEMGLIKKKEELSLAAKQAATLALIMEQTADAQGQAGREAGGASGSMRGLVTELKNISTEIGEILLPVITPLIAKLKEIIERFGNMSPEMQRTIVIVAGIAAAIGPLIVLLGSLAWGLGAIIGILPILGGGLAFLAGPVGIVIAIIAALIAIGVALYKNWDTIKAAAVAMYESIKESFNKTKDAIVTPITNAIDTLKKINLFEIGKNIISGLIDGVKAMIAKVKETIGNIAETITGGIKKALKIESPSRVMEGLGEYTGEGLIKGLESTKRALSSVSNSMGSVATAGAGAGSMMHSGTIRVEGINDKNQLVGVADIVMEQLRREARRR
ncbi:hypothetical protein [Acidaminobacter sp.]|uniref:hypothetical protein n=1 Tax=Acidaminobacter sp. TaxID=1872102 RepID=UPI002561008D|nr:hypothetical protein [Acidaminobacter sp.]MDK9712309.1 hypothetical protein [Acidaminobacter sp.]